MMMALMIVVDGGDVESDDAPTELICLLASLGRQHAGAHVPSCLRAAADQ